MNIWILNLFRISCFEFRIFNLSNVSELKSPSFNIETKFSSPEEELRFLREEVEKKERALLEKGEQNFEKEKIIAGTIGEYKEVRKEDILDSSIRLDPLKTEAIVLELSPEAHDRKMEELISIVKEKGIKNAFGVVEKLGDPHIYDDFHRFIVEYVREGFPAPGLAEKTPLWKILKTVLYEVSLPHAGEEDKSKTLKEIIAGMEQFYAGMTAVSSGGEENVFSIEIANANGSSESVFYVGVPDSKKALFEKQIFSIFHNAKVIEKKDDYNIFNEKGVSLGSVASLSKNAIFPLKTYEEFTVDPLNVLLSSFSKIDRDGEGASIQIIFNPVKDLYLKKYRHVLDEVKKGVPAKKAVEDITFGVAEDIWKGFKDIIKGDEGGKKKDEKEPPQIDEIAVENFTKKIGSPIMECNLRIAVSAGDAGSANEIISDIEAAFHQFENTHGNKIVFERKGRWGLQSFFREFSLRTFSSSEKIPLNISELTTLLHFPATALKSAPELHRRNAGEAPAPSGLPSSGVLLGINRNRNAETKIFMDREDRMRHFYTIGQTGTGKTTLLKNMIAEDIANGDGVCMIDPHGGDLEDILSVIPKERYEDVIYFDPSYTARQMGLNMLEYDVRFPEQKTFVVNEMLSIFDKLFDMKTAGGPMFEQYFRNSVMLTIEDPDTGNTLLDVSRVLSNKAFRDMKISRCKNPIVVEFWKGVAEKAGGEASLANIIPYVTSKFDNFLSNEIMRPIVSQEKSSFNFREIMDSRKILLVNLSKGRLGELNSSLIGLIIVGKILMSALSRVDSFGQKLSDFYLYIDEFQNVTTSSISTILAEARKYRLSLNIAHQFIAQLDPKIKDSVFGNVGSICAFRTGAEDAEYLSKQFEPVFKASDLINLENRNAYLKLLVGGKPARPFNIETLPPPQGMPEIIPKLKELSYLKFGRDRAEVEAEIMRKYQK